MDRKIAGSESGCRAGIQADLKTFAFHACHDTSAITWMTAQNPVGLARVDALPIGVTIAQSETVVKYLGVQATQASKLRCKEIIPEVTEPVETWDLTHWVVERAIGSRTGDRPLDDIDLGFNGHKMETLKIIKVETTNKRGTGCKLSAAIAANLALGQAPRAAVEMSKNRDTFFRSGNKTNS